MIDCSSEKYINILTGVMPLRGGVNEGQDAANGRLKTKNHAPQPRGRRANGNGHSKKVGYGLKTGHFSFNFAFRQILFQTKHLNTTKARISQRVSYIQLKTK